MMTDYIILAALWGGFCVLHSLLISVSVIKFMRDHLKGGYRFYRLFYNLLSGVTLAPVLFYSDTLRGEYFFRWGGYFEILRVAMIIAAAVLLIFAAKEYDWLRFAGIRDIIDERSGSTPPAAALKERGILGMVRHPLYTSVFLFIWAGNLNVTVFIINVILSIYLVIGTLLEERKLVLEFGSAYVEYKKSVPMFVPRLRR